MQSLMRVLIFAYALYARKPKTRKFLLHLLNQTIKEDGKLLISTKNKKEHAEFYVYVDFYT